MKYLLLGNGEIDPDCALPEADCVIQFNDCRHLARLKPGGERLVFVSNTGTPTARSVAFLLAARDQPGLQGARVVCARNPAFYRLKQIALMLCLNKNWRYYALSDAMRALDGVWPLEAIDFAASLRLERRMRRAGMARAMMPSTGMIAFDWVRGRMAPGDTLALAGFSWEGWEGHAWAIERRLMTALDVN